MAKTRDGTVCSAGRQDGVRGHVMSMLKWRVAPGGTDPEDAWVTFVLFIMVPSVSAARRLRVDFSDSFLTALRVSGVAIYSVLLPYYRSFPP